MANVFGLSFSAQQSNVVGSGGNLPNVDVVGATGFGIVGDGITDDTLAITAMHNAANAAGVPVSYAGLKTIAIQANAMIPVQTSTDFCGCKIVTLNGVATGTLTYNTKIMFKVTDPANPLVTISNVAPATPSTTLVADSFKPFNGGLVTGPAYARLTHSTVTVPDRYVGAAITGTIPYTQSFYIGPGGEVSFPLAVDLTANGGLLSSVVYRFQSDKRLRLANFAAYDNGYNNQTFLAIQRNNVDIVNCDMQGFYGSYSGASIDNICKLIDIFECGDITIDGLYQNPRFITGTQGSYGLNLNGCANIDIRNYKCVGDVLSGSAWGVTGTNNTNGVRYTDCLLNRIDAHSGGFNMFVANTVLNKNGVFYGWGGGTLSLNNVEVYDATDILIRRSDYSGTWFGNISVTNCSLISNALTAYAVRIENLGAPTDVFAPRNILVRNVLMKRNTATSVTFTPLRLTTCAIASHDTGRVFAPYTITIDGAYCTNVWRSAITIDVLNMCKNAAVFHTLRISVQDVKPSIVWTSGSTCGVYDVDVRPSRVGYLGTGSINDPVHIPQQLTLQCTDLEFMYVRWRVLNSAGSYIRTIELDRCRLSGLELVRTGATNYVRCRVRNCKFIDVPVTPSPASTLALGGGSSTVAEHTTFQFCEFGGGFAWDLSLAKALVGNRIQTGTTPVLPSGASVVSAFTGWYDSTLFAQPYVQLNNSGVTSSYALEWPAATATDKWQQIGIGGSLGSLSWQTIPVVRYSSTRVVTQPNTVNNEILTSFQLPKSTMGANGLMRIWLSLSTDNMTATTREWGLRVNTTNSLSGATSLLGTALNNASSQLTAQISGYVIASNNSTTSMKAIGSATFGATTVAPTVVTFDHDSQFWFIVMCRVDNTATRFSLNWLQVETVYMP